MGSKRRIFYNAPQKKIKQRRKNRYLDVGTLPKLARYGKSLEFQQKSFLRKKLKSRRYYPSRATFTFFNKIVSRLQPFSRSCGNNPSVSSFLKELALRAQSTELGVVFTLTKRGSVRLYKEERLISFLSFCFFKLKTLYKIGVEVQTLLHIGNSTQQYHMNTVGINYPYFATMSSGRCLRRHFGPDVSKSLKKSFKLNKVLIDYYFNQATADSAYVRYTHTLLKPFNKKALILLNQLQSNSAYYHTVLGFRKYYKVNYKTSRRVKKRIKKKWLQTNLNTNPKSKPTKGINKFVKGKKRIK